MEWKKENGRDIAESGRCRSRYFGAAGYTLDCDSLVPQVASSLLLLLSVVFIVHLALKEGGH